MILGRPWALVLLLVPPILLWFRLRAARPRAAEASSLLVWSKVAPTDAAPTKPRPPLAAWLEAAGAAVLVIGAADFAIAGPEASSVRILLDTSPSMKARSVPALPGPIEETPDPVGALPGLLAAGTPVVVVTDRRLPAFPDDPPRLQVVGFGTPGFNAGITAASGAPLPDGKWRVFLTIEAHGASTPFEAQLAIGKGVATVTVNPGSPLEVVRDVPGVDSLRAALVVDSVGDCLPDNVITLTRAGGAEVRALHPTPLRDSPLIRALAAAGAVVEEVEGTDSKIRLQPSVTGTATALTVSVPWDGNGEEVQGAQVVAGEHELVRDVKIDPTTTLGRHPKGGESTGLVKVSATWTIRDAEPILRGASGHLAGFRPATAGGEAVVVLTFVPGGTWVERDPSFVVFAKNLVEYAAGGPARLEAEGVLDPEETRQAAEGESFGDLAAALEAARRPDPAQRTSLAPVLLLAGAGFLAAAWFAGRG